jgi:DNA polymerase-3 subunit epsilon
LHPVEQFDGISFRGLAAASSTNLPLAIYRSLFMPFVAIDFETANPCLSSICQIGVAVFSDDAHAHTWTSLINPDDYFDPVNVSVHGIQEDHVKDAPRFPDVAEKLNSLLAGQVVAHHTGFDRVAFGRVTDKYRLTESDCNWLDTARVARRTWSEVAHSDYGLANVAKMLGIEFRHHAADEDARAAGEILLRAIRQSGICLSDWPARVKKPIDLSHSDASGHERHARTGNPDGLLAGETIVFTGALTIPRREAADLAAQAGCDVADNVTKETTLLVAGNQDIRMLAGQQKSSKHRKAENLIAKGQAIQILGESDFLLLIRNHS